MNTFLCLENGLFEWVVGWIQQNIVSSFSN